MTSLRITQKRDENNLIQPSKHPFTFKRGMNAIKEREWLLLSPKTASQQPWLQQPLFPKQNQQT
jgi:hypothetical protein